ncbi:MAG TPA: diacylglycerol kinase family protein [Candidatus Omnitrophota bacterium]|nr:diacylglycerol kinase family protein [Candidatus Omnitrophota bacterium]HNX81972.1 diacylglycerol kinase family protein [Candidatus Omnitrophota bacterium]
MNQQLKVIRHIFKFHGFRDSLKFALRGIVYLFLYHRNMRLIFMIGVGAILFGLYIHLRAIEVVALSITITLVFVAEIFNTAVELMLDMLSEEYHIKLKLIKDIAAAVVILTCLNAIAIGYILFLRPFLFDF